jgi:hypothetical protein
MTDCCTSLLYGPAEPGTIMLKGPLTWENGADGETRTPNRPITSRVRCQLRHAGMWPLRWYASPPPPPRTRAVTRADASPHP